MSTVFAEMHSYTSLVNIPADKLMIFIDLRWGFDLNINCGAEDVETYQYY